MDEAVLVSCVLSVVTAILLAVVSYQIKEIHGLRELVATDPLTGLLNRRAFLRAFIRLVELLPTSRDQRHGSLEALAVFFIDLDHFKSINDKYGHAVGDEVLQTVSEAIRETIRDSDVVCRWGGEEIVVALPNVCTDEAMLVAEKVRQAIADLIFSEFELQVTTSIGISCATERVNHESLIKMADEAVYQAKSQGRNRVVIL